MNAGYTLLRTNEDGKIHVMKNDIHHSPALLALLGDQAADELNGALIQFIPGLLAALAEGNIATHAERFNADGIEYYLYAHRELTLEHTTRWEVYTAPRDEFEAALGYLPGEG